MAKVYFKMEKCSKCGDPLFNVGGLQQGFCYPECGNQNMSGYGLKGDKK